MVVYGLEYFLSFFILFNRKICRNCKCGVEDHDVQLETEENKKVGKLFEDTKYTGLIAKLKRDGIPSYRGNQVTISISAATVSTATPVPAASLIPGSSQFSAPSAQPAYSPPAAAVHPPATGPTAAPGTGSSAAPGTGRTAASGPGHSAVSSAATPTKGPVAATTVVPSPTPVLAKTDVVKSVTYEWAPPGINQSLVYDVILYILIYLNMFLFDFIYFLGFMLEGEVLNCTVILGSTRGRCSPFHFLRLFLKK